ncbi:hypothetical protein [Marinimicrobium locisalis]|uniref:hypothetical protein n=1 Tax=Marinimicrobium locisalis TaxID=546022 RepID=UPI003221422E
MASKISVSIGMTGKEFVENNNLEGSVRVDRQPAGLNFYEYDWPLDNRGTIAFVHGEYGFEVDDVLSIMCPEDADSEEGGFEDISINFGFAGGGDVSHDLVRREFLDFIDHLKSLGWTRVVDYSDPRLTGVEAYNFHKNDRLYSFPLDYRLNLDEWMELDESTRWTVWAKDVFIELRFHRDGEKMDPEGRGNYLFVMKISSAEDFAKSYVKPEDRDKWSDLWEEEIRTLKRQRYNKEEQIKNAGGTIDTDYEDPIVHPKDPVEVEP